MATRISGPHATGDLDAAHRTQVWLAASNDPVAAVKGGYFFHQRPRKPSGVVHDAGRQNGLLAEYRRLSGVELPTE